MQDTPAADNLPATADLEREADRQRAALRTWALTALPRALTTGYRLAMADRNPAEIRKWVELLGRLGAVMPDEERNPLAGLSVFQFNFGPDGKRAVTIEAQATAVEQAVLKEPVQPLPEEVGATLPPLKVEDLTPIDELLAL